MNLVPVPVSCPLCGLDRPITLYNSKDPFMSVVRCGNCRMMYQSPRVAETDMPDSYEIFEGYRRFSEQDIAKQSMFRDRIARFTAQRSFAARGAFLDVGASRGVMLDCIREALPTWSRFGIELSPSARAEVVARGHTVIASLEELPAEQQFDWINIDNVLEHLPDPLGMLIQLRSRLRPDGFVYIDVPNESYFCVRYRINDLVRGFRKLPTAEGHINLFTSRTLRRLIAAAGYDCERFWLESVSVPHRLKGALGADASPRIQAVLNLLRLTRLDVRLGVAYFLAATIRRREA